MQIFSTRPTALAVMFSSLALVVLAEAPPTVATTSSAAVPPACCGVGMPRLAALVKASAASVASPTTGTEEAAGLTSASAVAPSATDAATTPPGMVWIPGGVYTRGTSDSSAWPAERPANPVKVDGFWMDKTEVTNEEFAQFVAATGYVTTAETTPSLDEIMAQVPPGTPPPPAGALVPGALVFSPPDGPVELNDESQWWKWVTGADWRHPEGPGSSMVGREKHPVVMVSWFDAQAYAKWAGKRLPTEAEWERAARGGLDSQEFIWGSEFQPGGRLMANVWQGEFPHHNTTEDGYARTAPVGTFPANGYGLYDMGGNVWEWCSDWFQVDLYQNLDKNGPQVNPQGPEKSSNPNHPFANERIIRGGSFLCHYSYCSSYRPSARLGNTPDTGMSHVGFRLVKAAGKSSYR